jgi:Tfp pilus assembly protein PilO
MTKMRQMTVLAAVAALAVLAGGWFLLVSPQRSKATTLHDKAAAQQATNMTLQNQLASLKSQHRDVPQVQAQLARLAVQMPNNPALPTLIRQLTVAADSAGVDLSSLAPAAPAFANASGSADGSVPPTSASTGPQLASISVALNLHGNYFQVEQFLSNLEALKRAFLVSGVTMAPGSGGGSSANINVAGGSTSTTAAAPTGDLSVTINGEVFMTAQPAVSAAVSTPATASAPASTSSASSGTTTP